MNDGFGEGGMRFPTVRQGQALGIIVRFAHERGFPPTLRELSSELGLSSVQAANRLLFALESKGHIVRTPRTSRGIRVTEAGLAAYVSLSAVISTGHAAFRMCGAASGSNA